MQPITPKTRSTLHTAAISIDRGTARDLRSVAGRKCFDLVTNWTVEKVRERRREMEMGWTDCGLKKGQLLLANHDGFPAFLSECYSSSNQLPAFMNRTGILTLLPWKVDSWINSFLESASRSNSTSVTLLTHNTLQSLVCLWSSRAST